MKKLGKKLMALVVALAMIATVIPVVNAEAATTKKVTMYVGEAFYTYVSGQKVKSVSSSDKNVVKASKDSDYKRQVNFTAKKAGKATITVKVKDYYNKTVTYKYAITVKKLSFDTSFVSSAGGYVCVGVKNKTAQTFDKVVIQYTFKDANGEVVAQNTDTVYRVPTKKTTYTNIYVGSSNMELIDLSQSSVKVTAVAHEPDYSYKDVSTKITVTPKDEVVNDRSVTFNITSKNTTNQYVTGYNYVMIYDEAGTLLGVEDLMLSLDKKETKTYNGETIYFSQYPTYDHYEIVTTAYYTAIKK